MSDLDLLAAEYDDLEERATALEWLLAEARWQASAWRIHAGDSPEDVGTSAYWFPWEAEDGEQALDCFCGHGPSDHADDGLCGKCPCDAFADSVIIGGGAPDGKLGP